MSPEPLPNSFKFNGQDGLAETGGLTSDECQYFMIPELAVNVFDLFVELKFTFVE